MPLASTVKDQGSQVSNQSVPSSAQASLVDRLPLKLVMMLAAPYLAGEDEEDALLKAKKLHAESRFASTIDILGEDAVSDEDCDHSVQNYINLIQLIAAQQIVSDDPREQITVSFKPSMFSVLSPASSSPDRNRQLDRAYERIESIVRAARDRNIRVTLEAEDHNWTDFQLDSYFSLLNAGYLNCGTVLQSRLFRSKNDLKRFDEKSRVRMLIGIYNEPSSIALTDKSEMKRLVVQYSREVLERGAYVELASHDIDCMKSFLFDAVIPSGARADKFEIQHLLGVPRREIQESLRSGKFFKDLDSRFVGGRAEQIAGLASSGVLMRMYLPFGHENVAGPYCKRRLKANPNMIGFGIKNFFHIK